MSIRLCLAATAAVIAAVFTSLAHGQVRDSPTPSAVPPVLNLYAAEIKVGPSWDNSKPPNEQAYFRDHSENLRALREQGAVVLGARYADKGLVVLQAHTLQEAHAMMQRDPSIQNRVFAYELHELNVFYGGAVQPRRRSQ